MNLGSLLVLLKLVGDTGFTVSPKTESRPPTSDRPKRPNCGAGKQAIWNEAFEKWDCVVEFD